MKTQNLLRIIGLAVFCLLSMASLASADANTLVRFNGAIGVIPVSNAAGIQNEDGTFPNVTRNTVRNVPPGGQPWVMSDLKAVVDLTGHIKVSGRGLLLAGGNGIGTNANAAVFATLFCENVEHSTTATGVPLEPNGDFRIDDVLLPPPPNPCISPILLIRSANGGRWFAAGIPD